MKDKLARLAMIYKEKQRLHFIQWVLAYGQRHPGRKQAKVQGISKHFKDYVCLSRNRMVLSQICQNKYRGIINLSAFLVRFDCPSVKIIFLFPDINVSCMFSLQVLSGIEYVYTNRLVTAYYFLEMETFLKACFVTSKFSEFLIYKFI